MSPNPSYLNQLCKDTWLISYQIRQHSTTKATVPRDQKPKVKVERVHTSQSEGLGAGET